MSRSEVGRSRGGWVDGWVGGRAGGWAIVFVCRYVCGETCTITLSPSLRVSLSLSLSLFIHIYICISLSLSLSQLSVRSSTHISACPQLVCLLAQWRCVWSLRDWVRVSACAGLPSLGRCGFRASAGGMTVCG